MKQLGLQVRLFIQKVDLKDKLYKKALFTEPFCCIKYKHNIGLVYLIKVVKEAVYLKERVLNRCK
jgi:hypothetical protein